MKKEMSVNKKAAMELSISTIVIIVLAMSMLILGIVLVRNIFDSSNNAVDSINDGVINAINELFTDSSQKLAFYPSTREIKLKQGDTGAGLAFSIRNTGNTEKKLTYQIAVDDGFNIGQKCQGTTAREADNWLSSSGGSFSLGPGQKLDLPELVTFTLPDNAPLCTVIYRLQVKEGTDTYTGAAFKVIIGPK